MKALLEFNLPEDADEFAMHNAAIAMSIALDDMDNFLRIKLKYQELTDTESDIYQEVRDKLSELTEGFK